jgi:hypothetical protein
MSMNLTFTYIDPNDVEISMSIPERDLDEMCEYFQRFLHAAGYIFEEGEHIKPVKKEPEESYYPGCGGDILTFNDDGTPFCYDFGDNNPVVIGSGIRGGMAEDIIKFD